jgi:hypothetical protein
MISCNSSLVETPFGVLYSKCLALRAVGIPTAICPQCEWITKQPDQRKAYKDTVERVDDRCINCKEFDLDGCHNCGPKTHAKVYGVDDD